MFIIISFLLIIISIWNFYELVESFYLEDNKKNYNPTVTDYYVVNYTAVDQPAHGHGHHSNDQVSILIPIPIPIRPGQNGSDGDIIILSGDW
jgi:hypothetical protein